METKQTTTPFRLIFWGIIVFTLRIQVERFDIINDFVGMLMILCGVVVLSRVPISVRYQRRMFFLVVLAFLVTIYSFFTSILFPFYPVLVPTPSKIFIALSLLGVFFTITGLIAFCRCMVEYCSIMNWEHAIAGWKYSEKWTVYAVWVPYMFLTIPLFVFYTSLEYVPKNPLPIRWENKRLETESQITAWRNGNVIYSTTVPHRPDGSYTFAYPRLDPSPSDGLIIDWGGWFAPVNGPFAWTVMLSTLQIALFSVWTIINILTSLHRTISAVEKTLHEFE